MSFQGGRTRAEWVPFVVGPQSQHFDDTFALRHLVHEPMLNADASRVGSGQVTHELFVGRRILKRVLGYDCEKGFGFDLEACCSFARQ